MKSAGLLLYRVRDGEPEVLLGHMGGPFWARKDERAWSIPKGEYGDDEREALGELELVAPGAARVHDAAVHEHHARTRPERVDVEIGGGQDGGSPGRGTG